MKDSPLEKPRILAKRCIKAIGFPDNTPSRKSGIAE
jgi:hypothetical protein